MTIRRLSVRIMLAVVVFVSFVALGLSSAKALACGYRQGLNAVSADITIIEDSPCHWAYSPQTIVIAAGTTVAWTNQTLFYQTSTSDVTVISAWDSGMIAPGGFFTHTFDTPGTFTYHCQFYDYMHGTIEVLAPASYIPLVAR